MTGFIIKYRWLIISICTVAGIIPGSMIPLSETDPEIRNYIPSGMESRMETTKIEDEFGVQDLVMILFSDSAILTPDNLQRIKHIDRDISRLSGISDRISLFTVKNIRNTDGMLVTDPLIMQIPQTEAGVRALKEDILNNRFARNIVVSSDFRTAAITATIGNTKPEEKTLAEIDSILTAHPGKADGLTGGLPYIRKSLMKDVKRDAVVLIPLALLIMLVILKISLGSWKSVFMPFSVVVIASAVSMGLIPLFGWKLSIITLLVPVILIGVANNYGIYLVARSQELMEGRPDLPKAELIREILGSLNMPILFSGLTTIAGVLGLLTHSIIPAKQVGALAGIGVTCALLMSLTLIPVFIYTRNERGTVPSMRKNPSNSSRRILDWLAGFIIRYPSGTIVIFTLAVIVLSTGSFLLKIETNQENFFPRKNPVRKASELINSQFGGSQTISVMITGDIKDPEIMKNIDRMTGELEKTEGVGSVFSISMAVREMSKAIFSGSEVGYDKIPDSREGIAQMFELYNMSGDQADFRQLMNMEDSKAHILIRLSDPALPIIKDIRTKINALKKNIPAEVTTGGYALIMTDFSSSIIRGQVFSLIFAMLTVFILLTIIFKSVKGGIIGSLPFTASVIVLFGFMGFAGIALDAATALISSIMIGVGVDFTIQYLWCFNIHKRKGLSWEDAVRASMNTIGRSIVINALTVMTGFSALMFSGFTSIRFFGYLVFISMGLCLSGALVLIPAILLRFKPVFAEKEMVYKNLKIQIKRNKRNEKENIAIGVPAAVISSGSSTASGGRDYVQKPRTEPGRNYQR